MCIAKPPPTESKEGKDQMNPPPPLAPDPVSQSLDSVGGASASGDAPMLLTVAPPSGDHIYLSDHLKEAHYYSPFQSSLKDNYSSWPSWQGSDEKSQVWDPEQNRTNDQNWLHCTGLIAPSRIEDLPSRVGAGLLNLGNTCFMNAILQCFTHTVPLIEGLCSSSHTFPCDCYHNEFCVICALRAQIELSLAASGRIVSPETFVQNLTYFSSSFTRYQQEDAHEFMQSALDKLDWCFLNLKENNKSFEDANLVEKIFGGRLISKLCCSNCGHSSNTYEPLIDMSLEIENVDSLPSALESFTKLEYIEANFKCDGCKKEVSLEKQLLLDQTPSVAAFHLKRFKTDGTFVEKLDKHVDFPLELDLQPYSVSNQNSIEPMKYDLYAVVVHLGLSATSGHYYCYVRSAPDVWHRLDDSQVTRVSADYVLSQEAYILFYAQHGTPWFSSIMESRMQCLDPSIWNTSPKSVLDRVELLKVNDTAVASHGCEQFPSKPNQEIVGLYVSALVDENSYVESGGADKNRCCQVVFDFGKNNDGFSHQTPPSLPNHDSPVRSYHNTRNHLKQNSGSGKRPKSTANSEREAAMRYARKLRRSRRDAIYELLVRSGKVLNKRKEVDSPLCTEDSNHSVPKKSNHASVMCPVAAGGSSQ
ncbi:PREDICTED: ubiquitin carboxyl-terminal hydrolase 20-like isoform X2 [Lupinus angustifolius]|uniref:ubiquitin carboxyl-terminal hydrolase 20-like isoform X2 n=1 Tax=Lupinus angustifolius TaxID=3871 RepID=UPI00092F769B|nr:PREDICTED: ubiquitin carboxyl-terminal hydrolase 20-like isoform X2 [Lupinus angustifolius]